MTEPIFNADVRYPDGTWSKDPVTVSPLPQTPGSHRVVIVTIGGLRIKLRSGQTHRLADALVDAWEACADD